MYTTLGSSQSRTCINHLTRLVRAVRIYNILENQGRNSYRYLPAYRIYLFRQEIRTHLVPYYTGCSGKMGKFEVTGTKVKKKIIILLLKTANGHFVRLQ